MTVEPTARVPSAWRAHPYFAALSVLAVLLVVLLGAWDWNWLKRPIERRVTAATGQAFTIGGPLEVYRACADQISEAVANHAKRIAANVRSAADNEG